MYQQYNNKRSSARGSQESGKTKEATLSSFFLFWHIYVWIGGISGGCTICVMSINDNGAAYYDVRNNVRSAVFNNVECDVSICITKQNRIPYIVNRGITYIQNENIVLQRNVTDNIVRIGENVTRTKATGAVNIRGRATIIGDVIELEDGVTITNRANVQFNNN